MYKLFTSVQSPDDNDSDELEDRLIGKEVSGEHEELSNLRIKLKNCEMFSCITFCCLKILSGPDSNFSSVIYTSALYTLVFELYVSNVLRDMWFLR